ncbi:RagB/SusD family nutrient uptake outer membrane protein [Labilibacter sediminis]|nr:RagB/SusD family nutrient uptake outer membrane protein [Labilibacter sediminis]
MNKVKQIIYAVVLGFVFTSCHDLLDVEAYSKLTDDNFWQNADDIEAGVNGVYDVLGDKNAGLYNKDLLLLNILSTDESYTTRNGGEKQISQFLYTPATSYLNNLWKGSYKLINRANVVINSVQDLDSTKVSFDEKRRYLGEVKFLRALSYFNLVRNYNNVPLKLKPSEGMESTHVPVAEVEDIYEVILQDLDSAIVGLPDHFGGGDLGRADKAAAIALKAKVYLTMAGYPLLGGDNGTTDEYQNALDLAKELIDNAATYSLGLWDNYSDAYTLENDNGKEDIFCVQFSSTVGLSPSFEGSLIHKECFKGKTINGFKYDGKLTYRPSTYLIKAFEKNDTRAAMISPKYTVNGDEYSAGNKNPMFTKWLDQNILDNQLNAQVSDQEFKVFRFAEIYLIAAEAENELNGPENAYQYINVIRARARELDESGNPIEGAVPDLEGLTQVDFRAAVLNERLVELHAEAKRWYDLVRTQTFDEQILAAQAAKSSEFPNPAPETLFFPIPYDEYTVNDSIDYVYQ